MKIKISTLDGKKSMKVSVTTQTYNKLVALNSDFDVEVYQSNTPPLNGFKSLETFLSNRVYFKPFSLK